MDADNEQTVHTANFKVQLFEHLRGMHRTWLKKLQEIRDLDVDYSDKLMAAKEPSEAAMLCSEWMAKRLNVVAREQEVFASSWARLFADVMSDRSAVQPEGDGRPHRGRERTSVDE